MKILITVKPRMYREAIAMSIHRHRPDAEVLLAPPESLDREIERFRPHLIVRNDGAAPEMLATGTHQVEVLYSDGMDAKVSLDGRTSKARDMSMDDLLRVIDEAEGLIPPAQTPG